MKILVIEDEPSLNKNIVEYLTNRQYLCESVFTYKAALDKIDCYEYDCIVLDIMLPDGNGLRLLEHLKANKKQDGVIIISARNELEDKIKGIESGADDYLTKPFHMPELGVRIAAIVRRRSLNGYNNIVFEEITVDEQAKTVTVHGTVLVLTKKEYQLLLYFIVNKNRVISKNAIAEHLWGDDMDMVASHDFLYTHIKNLRKKLEKAGSGNYIHSVYGMGYKFSIA